MSANAVIIPGADDTGIAHWLHGRLEDALAASHGEVAIAVPGGSTPFPILRQLVKLPLDWTRIAVWPTDDRIVPENHPSSNVGRIRSLLEPQGAHIVPLAEVQHTPHFTLTWLGMGADGHIASLFPNTDPQPDDPQWVRRIMPDPLPPDAPYERISLTIPALLYSGEVLFVIRGEDKLAVLEAALDGENDLPIARLLAAAPQRVTCFT